MKKLLFVALLAFSSLAFAGEDRVCSVTFTSGTAGNTSAPSSGTCSWQKGAVLVVQCDVNVYWTTTFSGSAAPVATATDFAINFLSNSDPYLVYLDASRQHISFLGVTSSGTCKIGPSTVRKKPL